MSLECSLIFLCDWLKKYSTPVSNRMESAYQKIFFRIAFVHWPFLCSHYASARPDYLYKVGHSYLDTKYSNEKLRNTVKTRWPVGTPVLWSYAWLFLVKSLHFTWIKWPFLLLWPHTGIHHDQNQHLRKCRTWDDCRLFVRLLLPPQVQIFIFL